MICGILDVFLFYFLISVPRLDLHVVNLVSLVEKKYKRNLLVVSSSFSLIWNEHIKDLRRGLTH